MAVMLVGLTGCKDKTKFTIDGEVAGQQSMNLYMRYYGNERVNTGVTAVTDGKFSFAGASEKPTVVEIMDNERRVLGRVYIVNGEKVDVKLDRNNPWTFSAQGGQFNAEWSAAVRANAGPLSAGGIEGNEAIEGYIAEHPGDIVSSLLFTTLYDYSVDPQRADSVAQSIDAEVRTGYLFDRYATQMMAYKPRAKEYRIDTLRYRPYKNDTVAYFTPSSKAALLAFTNEKCNRKDSIVPAYKELAKKPKLELLDIMLMPDTAAWKRMTRTDSATWTQGWAPGGVYALTIDSLAIPSFPFFIVVDTAGVQQYRGSSLTDAKAKIETLLK